MRAFAFLVVFCSLLIPQGAAQAAPDNPYWRTESNVPVDTISGEWTTSKDGDSVALTFAGHNVAGQQTKVVAGWLTPWLHAGSQMSDSGEIDLLETPVTSVAAAEMVRFQVKGESWSPWFEHELQLSDGTVSVGGNLQWAGTAGLFLRSGKVRYEWRLVGELDGPAKVEGSVRLSTD